MIRTALLTLPLLCLAACLAANPDGLRGITTVRSINKAPDLKSDPFKLDKAWIEGDSLKAEVSYAGGSKRHDFKLCWDQAVMKSYPPQIYLALVHDANGDGDKALITRTLAFELSSLDKPMVIHLLGHDGQRTTVQYGESKLD